MSEHEELSLEEQVERIRRKRKKNSSHDAARRYLNTIFLLLAAVGLVWFYSDDNHRLAALTVIGIGMIVKIVEFFLRFMG
ncbi:MAG: hypothetical protein K5945_03610 [Bacteroidaceae bacterium]|nr:hypothetical protein [Bacteroidaceae bacterium]